MCLASILNHDQTKTRRKFQDRIHVGGLSVEVDWHNGSDGPAAAAADELARLVGCALLFQILPQLFRIQVVGALVDVDELRKCSRLRNGFGGGDEGVRYGHDNVAGRHATRHDGEAQGIGAAADGDRMARTAERGKRLLEFFHHRTADETGGVQDPVKDGGEFLLHST